MKLNVIFVFRTINSIKLQGIHFYIIDINVSGNQGVNPGSSGPERQAESNYGAVILLPNGSKFEKII